MKGVFYGLLMAAAIGAGTATAQTATTASKDSALDARIEKRIHHDAALKRYDIGVSVESGVAKLTGSVRTQAARSRAAHLARVPGISRVDNEITVDAKAGKGVVSGTTGKVVDTTKDVGEKTKEKTKDVGEKTKDVAGKVANKTVDGVAKTGEVATDSWITTRVKSKFLDESVLKGSDIHVETNNHVVTLTGTVPSAAGRARAVEQAKEVEGVHQVVDKLMIGTKK
jgi:osmotically-inducible protein OsmY